MLNKLTVLFIFSIYFTVSIKNAHSTNNDSLQLIINSKHGQQKVDYLNEIGFGYCYNDPILAKKLLTSAIKLAEKESYNEGCGKALIRLGIAYDVSGLYDSSIYCYKKALTKYKSSKGLGSAYNNLGLIEWKRANLKPACDYLFKALPYFQQLEDKNYLANLYNNLGLIYTEMLDNKKALSFHLKALQLYNSLNDKEYIGATCTNLSNTYLTLNNSDSSEFYVKKSIQVHSETNNKYGLSIAYITYGILLESEYYKKYDESLNYFFKALKLKQELNEEEGIVHLYVNISNVYKKKNDWAQFYKYNYEALKLSQKNQFLSRQKKIYHNLAIYFLNEQNADSVFNYLTLYSDIKDSIFNQDFKKTLIEAETKLETKEKELTIKSQEYQINKKNYYITALSLLTLIIALIAFLIYYRIKQKQKQKLQQEIIKQQDFATKAILEAEDKERKRIAGDLHDSVGQILSAVKINLSSLQSNIKEENLTRYETIVTMVDNACKEVRTISHNMMPNSLLKSGLVAAIKEFISQIDTDILKVNLNASGLNQRLNNNTEMVLYRVIQECVNNVIKHAKASSLEIQITKDEDGIALTIEDNGIGFDTNQYKNGIGLENLKTRIDFLKGELEISSNIGKGTLIAIFLPNL